MAVDSELLKAVYHEAGHAVLAARFGFRVTRIAIRFHETTGRWLGTCRFERQPVPLTAEIALNLASVNVAGMLAEARYTAQLQLGTNIKIATGERVSQMLPFLLSEVRSEKSPGTVTIEFDTVEGPPRELTFPGVIFSQSDAYGFRQHRSIADPLNALVAAMRLLNDTDCWDRLEKLVRFIDSNRREDAQEWELLESDILPAMSDQIL